MNLSNIIKFERDEYKTLNIFLYVILGLLSIVGLSIIIKINYDIAGEVLDYLLTSLISKIHVLSLVVVFTLIAFVDNRSLFYVSSSFSGIILTLCLSLVFFLLFYFIIICGPLLIMVNIMEFVTHGSFIVPMKEITFLGNLVKNILNFGVYLISIPLAFIICWIPAKLVQHFNYPLFVLVLNIIFSYFVIEKLVFNIPAQDNLGYGLSDLFIINNLYLEYLNWTLLTIIFLKNIFIIFKEDIGIRSIFTNFKWLIPLLVCVILINILKSYYLINYEQSLMTTIFITIIVWLLTLSLENINVSLSVFKDNYLEDLSNPYYNFKTVLAIMLITIIYFCYILCTKDNNNFFTQLNYINYILGGFIFYLLISQYSVKSLKNLEDTKKLFISIIIGFFIFDNIENISYAFLLTSIVIFSLSFFMNFFTTREYLISYILVVLLITDNSIISYYFGTYIDFAKETLDLNLVGENLLNSIFSPIAGLYYTFIHNWYIWLIIIVISLIAGSFVLALFIYGFIFALIIGIIAMIYYLGLAILSILYNLGILLLSVLIFYIILMAIAIVFIFIHQVIYKFSEFIFSGNNFNNIVKLTLIGIYSFLIILFTNPFKLNKLDVIKQEIVSYNLEKVK